MSNNPESGFDAVPDKPTDETKPAVQAPDGYELFQIPVGGIMPHGVLWATRPDCDDWTPAPADEGVHFNNFIFARPIATPPATGEALPACPGCAEREIILGEIERVHECEGDGCRICEALKGEICEHAELDHGICLYCGEDRNENSHYFAKRIARRAPEPAQSGAAKRNVIVLNASNKDHAEQLGKAADETVSEIEKALGADFSQWEEL